MNRPLGAGVIRAATTADAAGVLTIYAPVVTDTAISFEAVPPGEAEMAARIEACNGTHRWLVAEADGTVTGYAYGTRLRPRHAYRYSAETSVYVHPDYLGRGLGTALYRRLLTELASLGCFHAFAAVTLPNEASVALHEKAGFRHVGTFPNVGFKFGRWHDVGWWYRALRDDVPQDDAPVRGSD